MTQPALQLSLRFGPIAHIACHRAALPRHWVIRCLRHALTVPGELAVRVVDADECERLNTQFRGKAYPTNVLTFDYQHTPQVVADVVLCAPVVAAEAKAQGKTLKQHSAHLLVHACLHAQGWDHEQSSAEAHAMEQREIQVLGTLGLANPYR